MPFLSTITVILTILKLVWGLFLRTGVKNLKPILTQRINSWPQRLFDDIEIKLDSQVKTMNCTIELVRPLK